MNSSSSREKLTLTIDKAVIQKAKRAADEKHIPLSRLIENFLEFLADPRVYCFKCGEEFDSTKSTLCPKCGWMICPECKVCRCGLEEETAVAVFHMRRVYENLLAGRVKES
jgi:hypothetical protein